MSFTASRVNPEHLRTAFAPASPALAIDLPPEVSDGIGVAAHERVDREGWRVWLPRLLEAQTVLLWVTPRRDDDQDFLIALARHLAPGAHVYTFHAMTVMTVDRLTGDAVQLLLTSDGLAEAGCVNTGFGYYARRFVRAPGTVQQPLPEPPPPPPHKPEPEPVVEVASASQTPRRRASKKAPKPGSATGNSVPTAKKSTAKSARSSKRT